MSTTLNFPNSKPYVSNPRINSLLRFQDLKPSFSPLVVTLQIRCAKRTGKQRYPSEKRRIQRIRETLKPLTEVKIKDEGFWRLSKLKVPIDKDPGKDSLEVSDSLIEAVAKVLEFPVASMLPREAFTVVRKSFDARKLLKEPNFVYTVEMDVKMLLDLEPRTWDFISRLEPKVGLIEYTPCERVSGDLISIINDCKRMHEGTDFRKGGDKIHPKIPKVAVVGSGPSGLFASLVLAELGADVTLIERGQAVEQRGRDIGALVVRRILQLESNFCFGEGGAGTWSDGKLVTRIGKNSNSVTAVNLNFTVEAFKAILAENCEVPAEQQRLIYKGGILKDDQTLESYGLQEDHTVHMVRGLSSSSVNPASAPNLGGTNTTPAAKRTVGSDEAFGGSLFPRLGVNGLGSGEASDILGAAMFHYLPP
ncbi:hypothetical protein GIB67_007897 [Kingdonia uniflora]|uniref:Ubiquitin-like domain-containing protein n=1 Tax=Kingdonia uniflora TaxID=39325 RepID=A0A7J7PBK0_9MAGN|nr:hypothetical protein GIB67_007897 [Kingdonia uniflora]